ISASVIGSPLTWTTTWAGATRGVAVTIRSDPSAMPAAAMARAATERNVRHLCDMAVPHSQYRGRNYNPRSMAVSWRGLRLRDVRHGGLVRVRLLARLRRIERGVLLAAQRLARELDQMVRGEAHAEHRLDLPLPQGGARRLPELGAIVRLP